MKVFLTGATGYIGSVIAEKLLQKGHRVIGLSRSDASSEILRSKNIGVVSGELDDIDVLKKAAGEADGVIHAGFKQRADGFSAAMAAERKAVMAMIEGLGNQDKPFIYTGGTGLLGDTQEIIFDEQTPDRFQKGKGAIDDNVEMESAAFERIRTEREVLRVRGIRGIVIRPPNVYGRSNGQALIAHLTKVSKRTGAVPYADFSRDHKWSFVHVYDLADLYVLALERSPAGESYYAGAQSGIKTKFLAGALSRGTGNDARTIETDMADLLHLVGNPFIAEFWTWNNQSSSQKAKNVLGWSPRHMDILGELAR